MRRILFDILEVNIAVSIVIVLVCLLEEKLRKRYGASWLKIVWFVLAVRLLIPYNFSLPFTELRFFNAPGFEQEENGFGVSTQGTADTGQEAVSGTEVPENLGQNSFQDVQSINISSEMQETESEGSGVSVQGSNSSSASGIIQVDQSVTEQKKPSSVELGITQNEHAAAKGNTSQNNQTDYAQNNQLSATQVTEQDCQSSAMQGTEQNNQSSAMQGMEQNSQTSIMQGPTQNNLPASSQNGMVSELSIGQKAVQDNHASYSDILVVVWLLGIGASILYFGLSNIGFYMNCRKTLQPYTESVVLKHVNHLQERILGRVKLGVYQSSAITSPMLVGLVKPKLVLPMQKQQWEKKELEYIVAHELFHYRNKDLWLKLLMMFTWCLNWFNPLVLLMKKKCFFHIELACDGRVLEGMEPEIRREYAGMLLTFAGRKQEVSAFSTNFGDSKKRMKQRIDYALDNRSRKKGIGSLVMVGIVLAASCLLISCGYKSNEVGVNELEPSQNQTENGSQVGQQTEQVAGQGVRPTEVPGEPTEETKGAGEPKPTGEPETTKEPLSTEEPAVTPIEDRKAVLTEEYELIYEDINMFRSGTTGSYFKYGDTYADLYMRRLQDDTREHIELSLWAPQQEIWHTDNGDDMEAYVDAYPLFWQEDSKNLTLEQRQCYYVVESDGTVYIMRYCVENTSNAVTMSYKVFGVSCNIESPYYFLGNEAVYDADSISVYLVKDSDIDSDVSFPIEQLIAFADRVKGYMENGHMVASTLHGAFEVGISPDKENPISPYLYDIYPWIPEVVTQHGINVEGIDSPKKLLTALQNALPTEDSVMMPDVAADGSCFITGDYYSDSDGSYLTVRKKEDGSYEGSLFIDNALVTDITGDYDNGILSAKQIVDYPDALPCEMEIAFQNGKATLTITGASEWSYPLQVGDTLTLDRDEKPEEFEYLRNAEYLANESNASNTSGNDMEVASTGYNWYTYGTQMYTISEAELGLKEHAVWMRYEEAIEKGEMVEYPGTLPGAAEGVWCCVTVDGVEYIYGRYDEQERYELYAYAIVGEECVLGNGLHVGMTRDEVLKLCTGIADAKLEEQEGYDLIWSSGCYPSEWEERFDYAMILDVDDGVEYNKMTYLALMMKDHVVCAMTPYVPITDGMVLPENPKDALDLKYEEHGFKVSAEDLAYEGLYVYERYVESERKYEVLLTNGTQEYIHNEPVGDYEVFLLENGHILLTTAAEKDSEGGVNESYILNVETMQVVGSVESPVAFMEANWSRELSERFSVVKLLDECAYIWAWKDAQTGEIYNDVTWGQEIIFEAVNGQMLCRIGLYLENTGWCGYVKLPYVAEAASYVIDRENVSINIDVELNNLASESFEDKYMKQLKDVDLDGDGVATDTLTLQRVRQGDKAHNLLTIVLDYGVTASLQLPSHEVYTNDHADIAILQDLQMSGRTSIGVFLQCPTGNYGSTDYYILHVEKDAEARKLEVKVDLSIYDGWGSTAVEASYPETVLKMPFESVTFYDESGVIFNETLQKNTLRVQGLSNGAQEEICGYVYWDENAWQVWEENSQNNPSKS